MEKKKVEKNKLEIFDKHILDILVFLSILLILNIGYFLIKSANEEEIPVEIIRSEEAVLGDETTLVSEKNTFDINTADLKELEKLPSVGPKIAQDILNYREENGDFSSIDDLKNVKGIGDTKLRNIKDYLKLE